MSSVLSDGGPETPTASAASQSGKSSAASDPMRAYRACLHCRGRKTKCNLEANGGRPPCKRCQRENRECILGQSHRGGRRVRKRQKTSEEPQQMQEDSLTPSPDEAPPGNEHLHDYPKLPQPVIPYNAPRVEAPQWQGHRQLPSLTSDNQNYGTNTGSFDQAPRAYGRQSYSTESTAHNSNGKAPVHESITIANFHNPSDALEILARVADRVEIDSPDRRKLEQSGRDYSAAALRRKQIAQPQANGYIEYQPVSSGLIAPEMVYELFSKYERQYHPFFPVVPYSSFQRERIMEISKSEPHLFSAILTVASKENVRLHQICYKHMQALVAEIVCGGDAGVEAVEALLLLSQWIGNRPQSQSEITVGRGEEDRVAWMYIGTACRLGWYLGIDRIPTAGDRLGNQAELDRHRLVWSMCYMADRNVSVRLGKGFGARGPEPRLFLQSSEYAALEDPSSGQDLLMSFRAQLQLTVIFSNVHDILYKPKGQDWLEMREGGYAKYLDDFTISIDNWNETWGSLACDSRLKLSLRLSYDYLRLYVNAFAYQATISRVTVESKGKGSNPSRSTPLLDASTPDARFIFEAIDAAKALITTFNKLDEPEALRYMPYRYYMYIVYGAVFLFKARSTIAMSKDERHDIRHMVSITIDGLRKSSTGASQMGSRYSQLLELLWRKNQTPSPQVSHQNSYGRQSGTLGRSVEDDQDFSNNGASYGNNDRAIKEILPAPQISFDLNAFPMNSFMTNGVDAQLDNMSWQDLGLAFNFATEHGSIPYSQDQTNVTYQMNPNIISNYPPMNGSG